MFLLYLITLLSILSILFIERKKPGEALVWILVLIFIPGFGLILYFFFGATLRFKLRKFWFKYKYEEQYERLKAFCPSEDRFKPGVLRFHQDFKVSSFTKGNNLEIFTDGNQKYKRLFDDLKKAKSNIHIMYFAIKSDATGRELIRILEEKAAEGVEVRVLYDKLGTIFTLPSFFWRLKRKGGRVSPIRPFLLDFNFRNHRKIVVIDGKVAYTGGMNIGDKYRGKHRKRKPWRDTHIRLEGKAAHSLQYLFLNDWVLSYRKWEELFSDLSSYFPPIKGEGDHAVQVVTSGPGDNHPIKLGYLKMLSYGRKSLLLQTPYVIPDETILTSLQVAAASGMEVKLMVPSIPGNWFLKHTTNYYLDKLVDFGVRVFLYPGYIHAKTLLVDGELACIGSVNLDIRSLEINDEIYTVFPQKKSAEEYARVFQKDLEISTELDYEKFKGRGIYAKVIEAVLSFFSPLI